MCTDEFACAYAHCTCNMTHHTHCVRSNLKVLNFCSAPPRTLLLKQCMILSLNIVSGLWEVTIMTRAWICIHTKVMGQPPQHRQRIDNQFWLSLCTASRMWFRYLSVVIVPPEESRWDLWKCWCFIHVTVKLVLGMTQKPVIESWNTHFSFSPPETVRREKNFRVDRGSCKKERKPE